MCRLSIIVPYDRDEAAFEATLVSVLENRPEFSEVIVPHDGGYCDPFDLSDEVKFVIGDSAEPVSLVQTAVSASLGRIVHVLRGGARATEGWVDEPLSMFEQSDLACVAPVIRDLSTAGRIVAAGWSDTTKRLRQPLAAGSRQATRRDAAAIRGAYLAASFWRRGTLEALGNLPLPTVAAVADYLWAQAIERAGWRCRLATSSTVLASPRLVESGESEFRAAAAMQGIRHALRGRNATSVCAASLLGIASSPFRGTAWSHGLGRISAAMKGDAGPARLVASIDRFSEIAGPNAGAPRILSMASARHAPLRRAA